MSVGRGSARNAAERSSITLCYPPVDSTGFSLIVDGVATVSDDRRDAGADRGGTAPSRDRD